MQASKAGTTTAAAAGSVAGSGESTTLRACSTSGCKVNKFVEVTKRKCSQFVSAPYIMPKPLVVNGKTSIFQVGGEVAKMGDIPSLAAAAGPGEGQPIYRIKPGTHAHVINYVFVDEGSDSMEKAKSEDQEAMRMLLDSQRESAAAKLLKLISTHRGSVQPTAATSATAAATITAVAPHSNLTKKKNVQVSTPQIHPDLSIASVAGALSLTANLSPATAPIAAAVKSVQHKQPTVTISTTNSTATTTMDDSVQQLQAEILKLRRTVARLGGGVVPD